MVSLADYYLLPVPIIILFFHFGFMASKKYVLPIVSILFAPCVTIVLFTFGGCKLLISIYYGIICVCASIFFILSRIPNKYDITDQNSQASVIVKYEDDYSENITSILNKSQKYEDAWQKGTAQISISVLSACVAFAFVPERERYAFLYIPVLLLFFSSLITLASSALLSLSSYFRLSYPVQAINKIHRGLHRLNFQLGKFWHMLPLCLVLFQLILAGHIIISLLFNNA